MSFPILTVRMSRYAVLLSVSCLFAQEASAPSPVLTNSGAPMSIPFDCDKEDLTAAGMSCTDDARCPIYVDLGALSISGAMLAIGGNIHGPSVTLGSTLLLSEDAGMHWTEKAPRVSGAAIEDVQVMEGGRVFAAGETQVPLARGAFVLSEADGKWRTSLLTDEESPGAVQRIWFDSPDHGQVVVDAGRTAWSSRYVTYQTRNAGESWAESGKSPRLPAIHRGSAVEDPDYRISSNAVTKSFVLEKRTTANGRTRWSPVASFLVQIAACGARHLAPAAEPAAVPEPDAK